jgi:hypothetical protein
MKGMQAIAGCFSEIIAGIDVARSCKRHFQTHQYPYGEQQLPNFEPWQVNPLLPPQLPSEEIFFIESEEVVQVPYFVSQPDSQWTDVLPHQPYLNGYLSIQNCELRISQTSGWTYCEQQLPKLDPVHTRPLFDLPQRPVLLAFWALTAVRIARDQQMTARILSVMLFDYGKKTSRFYERGEGRLRVSDRSTTTYRSTRYCVEHSVTRTNSTSSKVDD